MFFFSKYLSEMNIETTVNGHKYSSPSILHYIFHIKPHFSKKIIVKLFLNGF